MKKIKLRKRYITKRLSVGIVWVLLGMMLFFVLINRINKKVTPILIEEAEIEVNKFSTVIVNKAINHVLGENIDENRIFTTIVSENGEIQTIDFNPIIVNQILNAITTTIQEELRLIENGQIDHVDNYNVNVKKAKKGIIAEIPIGVIFNNSLFSNIGPRIPIRLHFIGDVNTNIKTKVTSYGINNALVEIGVDLEMTAQIILPFITQKTKLKNNFPIAIKVVNGSIPSYYGSGLLKDSNLYSFPLE